MLTLREQIPNHTFFLLYSWICKLNQTIYNLHFVNYDTFHLLHVKNGVFLHVWILDNRIWYTRTIQNIPANLLKKYDLFKTYLHVIFLPRSRMWNQQNCRKLQYTFNRHVLHNKLWMTFNAFKITHYNKKQINRTKQIWLQLGQDLPPILPCDPSLK